MAVERRDQARYEPTAATDVRLLWQDDAGGHRLSGRLSDLSAGGCALVAQEPPPVDAPALVQILLSAGAAPPPLKCHILSRNPQGDRFLVSVRFEHPSDEQLAWLAAALASAAFRPQQVESIATRMKYWRVPQWSAFLTAQQLPVMGRSKLALAELEAGKGEELAAEELAELALGDPFLCLTLLREAEHRRTSRLGNETSTPLAAVMQLGDAAFRELLLASPETDETNAGLVACEARAVLAGRLAAAWSKLRIDAKPDEVSMAALLADIGELMLWHFAPQLPEAATAALAGGRARRNAEAQEMTCGFKFRDLTVKCAELWKLPALFVQLIRGHDTARANLARVSRDTVRHMLASNRNPALPDDLAAAAKLVPTANPDQLAAAAAALLAPPPAPPVTTADPPP